MNSGQAVKKFEQAVSASPCSFTLGRAFDCQGFSLPTQASFFLICTGNCQGLILDIFHYKQ